MRLIRRLLEILRRDEAHEVRLPRRRNEQERSRRCRFEPMEDRRLLAAAPITIGATYLEEDGGKDLHGDTFEIKFEGGAANTEVTRIVINGDHDAPGYSVGDMIFDTEKGGYGADEAFAFTIVSQTGIDKVSAQVVDGSSTLILTLQGFHAGDKLIFSIDVDEIQDFDPNEKNIDIVNEGIDPIASGVEFQGSILTADFKAPDYYDVSGSGEFRNVYDKLFVGSNLLRTDTNTSGLPYDDYLGKRDRSTGVAVPLQQKPIPASIAGYVYRDFNDNGLRQTGETGIPNVPVRVIPLSTVEPQAEVSVLTDANGFYKVEGLMPGQYRVIEVTQPAPYFDGKDAAGTIAGVTVGNAVNPGDNLETITLRGGDAGIEYNFGELDPGSLRGRVRLTDRDGDCDGPLSKPIPQVTVRLYDGANNLLAETLTDAQGEYVFTNLRPGTYKVVELTPAGYIDGDEHPGSAGGSVTADDTISSIQIGAGAVATGYDFCEHAPAMVSGHVYHDQNNNGKFDAGETPIGGATVTLVDTNGVAVGTQTTNAAGFYEFTGLRAGGYSIVETQPNGYLDGLDAAGTIGGATVGQAVNPGDRIQQVTLKWGDAGINYDFGELKPGSIAGRVFSDPNQDCEFNTGDSPLSGVTIYLYDANGTEIATTQTDSDGRYQFNHLAPGTYSVREVQPTGYFQGGTKAGSGGGTVTEDRVSQIGLGSGQALVNYDFCEVPPSTLEGIVYVDLNQNCQIEAGEQRLSGVTIRLYDQAGNVLVTTTTDTNGHYKFENLKPGSYMVRETQPAGYFHGCQSAGSHGGDDLLTDEISKIGVPPGQSLINYNFGEIPPSTIRGRVHAETDDNCVVDPGELLLEGVTIRLKDGNGNVVAETQTDLNGEYEFTGLRPGTYRVEEDQPLDYFNGGQVPGSGGGNGSVANVISDIVLGPGATFVEYNFCETPPARLSGYVFQDGDDIATVDGKPPSNLFEIRDGQFTIDDTPIAGVVLELRNGINGKPIQASEALPGLYAPGAIRVTTDAFGYYEFVGIRGGRSYAVYEVHPDSYHDSLDTPGTNGGLAFNANKPTPEFVVQQFADVPKDDAIVRIPVGIGASSDFNNFSEVRVFQVVFPPPEFPPSNPPPPVTPPPPPGAITPPLAPTIVRPVVSPETLQTYGGRATGDPTWHLSVIDAGKPRGTGLTAESNSVVWSQVSLLLGKADWATERLREGQWVITVGRTLTKGDLAANTNLALKQFSREFTFGIRAGIPVTGDFNGDGLTEAGVYYNGEWFIDLNGNGVWDDEDLWAKLGTENDLPVTGDWNGDGKDDIGIFGPEWPGDPRAIAAEPGLPDFNNEPKLKPKNVPPVREEATDGHRLMKLTKNGRPRADLIDHVFRYGKEGDTPITGDWDGDGIDSIGIFRDGQWLLDINGDGHGKRGDYSQDVVASYGQAGDIPVIGDFDGDGVDEIGVFRDGTWYIDINHNRELDAHDRVFELGGRGDTPVVGDWDGDGTDDPGLYRDAQPPARQQARR